jgi:GNAT superfamily N-acetyltransferase
MSNTYFERLIQLADSVFSVRTDPDQLDVNQEVLEHLEQLHPYCVSEWNEDAGPVCWVLLFPTTTELMHLFLENEINEKQLYERTPLSAKYDCIYLCSALVLEEFRRKGIASQLSLKAIEEIRKDYAINSLFAWTYTAEGEIVAKSIASKCKLPLLIRNIN